MGADQEKKSAAEAAALLVEDGMMVGLGTGSTVAYLLPAIARRGVTVRCVATSPRTEEAARALGLQVESFGDIDRFDIAIDGADEVTPDGWLIKGGGAAHTREKIVANAADRFVVIADSSKAVRRAARAGAGRMLEFGLAAHHAADLAGDVAGCAAQPGRRRHRRLPGIDRRSRCPGRDARRGGRRGRPRDLSARADRRRLRRHRRSGRASGVALGAVTSAV